MSVSRIVDELEILTEVVLLFRPSCSLIKVDQGFIQAAILIGFTLYSYASSGVNIPWDACGRSALWYVIHFPIPILASEPVSNAFR